MTLQVLMAHKEFTGTWSGHGWRCTLKDWPSDVSPGSLSVAIYDNLWNYLYTIGAFQYDGTWHGESPAGQLTPEREPIYWGVLEGADIIGQATLPVDENSVVLNVEPSADPKYVKLSRELQTDPKARGYTAMSNSEAADDINEIRYTEANEFDITTMNQYLVVNNKMQAIEASNAQSAVNWGLLTRYFPEGVSATHQAAVNFVVVTLDGLQTDGLITENDRENMGAGTETGVSRGQQITTGIVTSGDVGYARANPVDITRMRRT